MKLRRTFQGGPQRRKSPPLDQTISPLTFEPDEPDRPCGAADEECARDVGFALCKLALGQLIAPTDQRAAQALSICRRIRTSRPCRGYTLPVAPDDERRPSPTPAVAVVQLDRRRVELDDETSRAVEPLAERHAHRAIVAAADESDSPSAQRPAPEHAPEELTIALLGERDELAIETADGCETTAPGCECRLQQAVGVRLIGESSEFAEASASPPDNAPRTLCRSRRSKLD